MSTIFDIETVFKAGRAASRIAREEQSGKFLPPPGWKGRLVAADDAPRAPRKKRAG